MSSSDERLIWVDLETTGLDPKKEVPLEIGFTITDLDLNILDTFHALIWEDYFEKVIGQCDPFVEQMHATSGLLVEARDQGRPLDSAVTRLEDWLTEVGVDKSDGDGEPLCGSSVQFDRGWMEEWFPDQVARFSYRNIDISSVKELCKRYNPLMYAKIKEDLEPMKLHRALPDLKDTIAEFEWYRDNFLFWSDDSE